MKHEKRKYIKPAIRVRKLKNRFLSSSRKLDGLGGIDEGALLDNWQCSPCCSCCGPT